MPDKIHLDSSHLKHFTYDPESSTLEITFKNRRTYRYTQVPKDIAAQLQGAESAGQFFHDSIRTQFPFEEL